MFKQSLSQATTRKREGLVPHVLLQKGDLPDSNLAITWVELASGSRQTQHHHEPEHVYVIIKGNGHMKVGEEEAEVVPGDLVYIPPYVPHCIVNTSTDALAYISASTPSFDIESLYDTGRV